MRQSLARRILVSVRPRATISISSRQYATPVKYDSTNTSITGPQEEDPQLGGYPQLPWLSNQLRPARGWWDQQGRRNFGEPLHEEDEALNMWSPDPPVIPPEVALRQFIIAWLGIIGFGYIIYLNVPERPAIARQYPYNGLVKELGGLEENKANPHPEDGLDE